jgi:hypothetical protein
LTDLLRVAMQRHPSPLLLCCETLLPFLSDHSLHHLWQAGISLLPPLWLERFGGSGRATALAPFWCLLKERAESLRSVHSRDQERWILDQAVRDCTVPEAGQGSLIGFGKILPPQGEVCGRRHQQTFNDPSLVLESKEPWARTFLTPASGIIS